jgi:hypothetical protein
VIGCGQPCHAGGPRALDGADTLHSLAEIAIGLAGFSAIVVIFKRRDRGTWLPEHADRFHGMVVHSMVAALFAFLPEGVAAFTDDPAAIWGLSSALLGAQALAHTALVLGLATTQPLQKVWVGAAGAAVVVLQGLNALGLAGFDREPGAYVIGVLWHLATAGFLFVMLIWVRDEDIERR